MTTSSLAANAPIVRVPAEWEPQEAIWLQWPGRFEKSFEPAFAKMSKIIIDYQKLHVLTSDDKIKRQAQNALREIGVDPDHANLIWHKVAHDSAWMRDNGPVYVIKDGEMHIQNWQFDAWGGAFGQDIPFAADNRVPDYVGDFLKMPVEQVDIVHERGNLEFNGDGSVILNWSTLGDPRRNPGYSQKQAEQDLKRLFGVHTVVFIEGVPAGDLTNGHIDGIARFINPKTVVVPQCTEGSLCGFDSSADAKIYNNAAAVISAAGFTVIRDPIEGFVNYRNTQFDTDYMNWIVGNGFVLVVGFDNPQTDKAAKSRIESYYPGREVFVIEMLESWYNGGGAHCHTNDQPALPSS